MKDAFLQLSSGRAVVPLRTSVEIANQGGNLLFMPSYLPEKERIGFKAASTFWDNPANGLPLIHALMMVIDSTNGRPLGLMDGEYLTALRTGAASGLATDLLARKDAERVAVFGPGVQGRTQLEAIAVVRDIKEAYIFSRDSQKATSFAEEMQERISIEVVVADSPGLLARADIVSTATTSSTPVFSQNDLKPGAHINAIGSFRPNVREIPGKALLGARIVVDHYESCLSEAGDLIIPIKEGLIDEGHIHAEIGEIVAGGKSARGSQEEVTLFKSVGNAVQDLTVASHVLASAQNLGLGTKVSL